MVQVALKHFGNDGFFLFAGTGNNTILKYKVQR